MKSIYNGTISLYLKLEDILAKFVWHLQLHKKEHSP